MGTKCQLADEVAPVFCARCAAELHPGAGNFYRVTIEAVADPTPPDLSDADLAGDLRARLEQLIADLDHLSEQEAMDQIYRKLVIYLCTPCYRQWIENPAG